MRTILALVLAPGGIAIYAAILERFRVGGWMRFPEVWWWIAGLLGAPLTAIVAAVGARPRWLATVTIATAMSDVRSGAPA